jgi:hypothetical protein
LALVMVTVTTPVLGLVSPKAPYATNDCGHDSYENSGSREECFAEQLMAREELPDEVKLTVPVYPQLPRVHVDDLDRPENNAYKIRSRPFVLTGAMDDWPAFDKWSVDLERQQGNLRQSYLAQTFPKAVCDFYPYNMLEQGTHPFLIRLGSGLDSTLNPPGNFPDYHQHQYACEDGCRYIHVQLTPSMWKTLETRGDMPKKRHKHTKGDSWWMRRCLKDPRLVDEYHVKTHWKIILVGNEGAGMFNHTDSLMTASWHGHVQGRKWWYLCGRNEGPGPREGEQECWETIGKPGEILYYGRNWWHTTRNLDAPTMTITGTVITRYNFDTVADQLHSECSRDSLSFSLSGELCDALDSCYGLWHQTLTGKPKPADRWAPWRTVSTPEVIKKRDGIKPEANNYDGRNYITE